MRNSKQINKSLLFENRILETIIFLNMSSEKREHSDSEEEWIGPLPSEAAPLKKKRGLFNITYKLL